MLNPFITKYFPDEITNVINDYFEEDEEEKNKAIEEIRLRTDRPILLKFNKFEKVLDKIVTKEEILKTIQYVCDNSNEEIINVNYISSLNFRIAKEIKGASNKLLKFVLNLENNSIYTTLIVSPPGVRKNNNT